MCDRFPAIGQFRNFAKDLVKTIRTSPDTALTSYTLTGTVKLHGTHADIVATKNARGEYEYQYQSRNRLLTLDADNAGFVHFMSSVPRAHLDDMVNKIEIAYMSNNMSQPNDQSIYPILIAGEFCGGNIQDGVALDKLPKMLVLYRIKMADKWQPMRPFHHIHLEHHRIYNISRAPTYKVIMHAATMFDVVSELQTLTLDVERECPFAKTFGVSGVGEGIVWVCDELVHDPQCWFKVKGDKHTVSHVTTLKDISPELKAKLKAGGAFAEEAVTEARMLQGVEYLREMMLPITMSSFPAYLKWLIQDTLNEEKDAIDAVGVDVKMLTKSIAVKGRDWYQAYLVKMKTAESSEMR